jgi:MarR family transcriptional regulator, organic hydroperoxide resistance regulator
MSDTAAKSPSNSTYPGESGYRLTASFPYLVRRVGLRIGELFDRAVAALGIDVSMYRVLAALAEQDNQQLGQLAAITTIELSTLSRLVGTMAAMGLLTRRRPRGNGRIVEISLSAKGRRLTEQLIPIAEHFEAVAVAGLMKSDLDAAYRNLDRLEQEFPEAVHQRPRSAGKGRATAKRQPAAKRGLEA